MQPFDRVLEGVSALAIIHGNFHGNMAKISLTL